MKLPKQKRCNPLQQLERNVASISNESDGHQDLCCDIPTSPPATNNDDSNYGDHVWLDVNTHWQTNQLFNTVTPREGM